MKWHDCHSNSSYFCNSFLLERSSKLKLHRLKTQARRPLVFRVLFKSKEFFTSSQKKCFHWQSSSSAVIWSFLFITNELCFLDWNWLQCCKPSACAFQRHKGRHLKTYRQAPCAFPTLVWHLERWKLALVNLSDWLKIIEEKVNLKRLTSCSVHDFETTVNKSCNATKKTWNPGRRFTWHKWRSKKRRTRTLLGRRGFPPFFPVRTSLTVQEVTWLWILLFGSLRLLSLLLKFLRFCGFLCCSSLECFRTTFHLLHSAAGMLSRFIVIAWRETAFEYLSWPQFILLKTLTVWRETAFSNTFRSFFL